jgi:hypothetical protein
MFDIEGDLTADFYGFSAQVYAPECPYIEEVERLIGYAFREVLAGEEVRADWAEGQVVDMGDGSWIFPFFYDATKSRRDDPDVRLACQKAATYLAEGTPVRKTNRAGEGTKGTRKFEGVGATKAIFFSSEPLTRPRPCRILR